MKKAIKIILFAFIIFFSIANIKMHDGKNVSEKNIMEAFNTSGARFVNSEIYIWGKSSNLSTIDKLIPLAHDITGSWENETGLRPQIKVIKKDDGNEKIEAVLGVEKSLYIAINKQQEDRGENGKYLALSIVDNSPKSELEIVKQMVLDAYLKFEIKPEVNLCITGCIDGKLDRSEIDDITGRIFGDLTAKRVETTEEGNLVAAFGYSPYIRNTVNEKGKRINLSAAIRYNSFENKTYLWLATPVILKEY